MKNPDIESFIIDYCAKENLSGFDPYDIWKSKPGYAIKNYYNHNKYLALPFAAVATVWDVFFNNKFRVLYKPQEYPIVRAMAALALINLYHKNKREEYLQFARKHIDWLLRHPCRGYSGKCWGINFRYPVSKGLVYDANTPFVTVTPYVLEALHEYVLLSGDPVCIDAIKSIFRFFKNDIRIIHEDEGSMATSYSPFKDRIVINSLSYTMYSYALFAEYYLDGEEYDFARSSARKIFQYIVDHQNKDGSWMYSVENNSFIDCFHSCFVLKNIIKANRCMAFTDAQNIVSKGYEYIKDAFWVERAQLFKRFAMANKIGITKYDLYDNAEALNLAVLMKDKDLIRILVRSIFDNFHKRGHFYSMIDMFGVKRNMDMLRWAVMPLLYALSKVENDPQN